MYALEKNERNCACPVHVIAADASISRRDDIHGGRETSRGWAVSSLSLVPRPLPPAWESGDERLDFSQEKGRR